MRKRPDFRQIDRLLIELKKTEEDFRSMFAGAQAREEAVLEKCRKTRREQAVSMLGQIPVEELRRSRAGIRTALLEEAGFHTLLDLYKENDWNLQSIDGIGEKQAASIRTILEEFLNRLAETGTVRLSPDRGDRLTLSLITELAALRREEMIRRDAEPLREELTSHLEEKTAAVVIRNRFHWFFSGSRAKEQTTEAIGRLLQFMGSAPYIRAVRLIGQYRDAAAMSQEEALDDFRKNSASYYALMERITGAGAPLEKVYSTVPARLAAQIAETELNRDCFRGNLRAYQIFGAQYILAQKRVLLGDEMGLGKTVQAIAAMAHLQAERADSWFLVVCPASVMINWCREITKFSTVRVHLLHGQFLQESFARWRSQGGAAVTNYESMGKIVGDIDGKMRLSLLVIDEAHYIKNPGAQRTRYIHSLDEESDRILMMTGTPLENRVEEMCELIGFVRPDMSAKVRENAGMRHIPAFREMLAPVYLRRLREQVLEELPPLTEQQEWCAMTAGDMAAYGAEVLAENFTGMRRVSFLQEDMGTSSKAARLLELCAQAADEGRKVVVYSYFRETIRKVTQMLEETRPELFLGEITGSTPARERQTIIDSFEDAPGGSVLVCQVQSGGTGLNIQAASVVIFCEPQIKPSLARQSVSRVYRMGQIRNVLVCHLLCENTVDEAVMKILEGKQEEFDLFADDSVLARAEETLADRGWISRVIEEEHRKYLPAPV